MGAGGEFQCAGDLLGCGRADGEAHVAPAQELLARALEAFALGPAGLLGAVAAHAFTGLGSDLPALERGQQRGHVLGGEGVHARQQGLDLGALVRGVVDQEQGVDRDAEVLRDPAQRLALVLPGHLRGQEARPQLRYGVQPVEHRRRAAAGDAAEYAVGRQRVDRGERPGAGVGSSSVADSTAISSHRVPSRSQTTHLTPSGAKPKSSVPLIGCRFPPGGTASWPGWSGRSRTCGRPCASGRCPRAPGRRPP